MIKKMSFETLCPLVFKMFKEGEFCPAMSWTIKKAERQRIDAI